MADIEQNIALKASSDQTSFNNAAKSIDGLENRLRALDKANTTSLAQSKKAGAGLKAFKQDADEATKSVNKLNKELTETASAQYDAKIRSLREELGKFGDASGALSPITSLASTAGISGAGELGGAAQSILDIAERGPELKASMIAIGEGFTKADGPAGKLIQTASGLVSGLTGISAGAAGLLVVIGPLVAAFAAIALAASLATKASYDQAAGTRALLASQDEYYAILQGTSEDAQKSLEDTKASLDSLKAQRDELTKIEDDTFAAAQAQFGDFGARLGLTAARAFNSAGINDVDAKINDLNAQIAEQEFLTGRLEGALADNTFATNDAAIAEEDLTQARETAAAKITQLTGQLASVQDRATEEAIRLGEDRAIRDRRAQEDLDLKLEQEQARHEKEMEGIQSESNSRIKDLRTQASSELDQLASSLVKANAEALATTNLAINSAIAESGKRRASIESKFRADEAKAEAAYNKARLRASQDSLNTQLDAEEANDVVGLINERRRASEEAQRAAEDEKERKDEAKASKDAALAAEKEALDQKLADIRANYEAEKQERELAAQEQRASIEANLLAAIAAEEALTKASLEQKQLAFDEQQKLDKAARDLSKSRQIEDDKLADQRRLERNQKEVDNLKAQIDKETAIVNAGVASKTTAEVTGLNQVASTATSVFSGIQAQVRAITSAMNGLASKSSGGTSNGTNSSYYNPKITGNKPVAFASGDIVDRPTPGMFGDVPAGYAEAIIPFQKSRGLASAMQAYGMGGPSVKVEINGPVTFNEGVTPADLDAGLEKLGMTIASGLNKSGG